MKILLSNDDGYQAAGIVALYEALCEVASVEVVAPEHNNSAKSNALTLHSPLYVQTAGHNGFRYINGTPADCVHIALTGLLGYTPDLVVSGINNGECKVSAFDLALLLCSGATTSTLAISHKASYKATMPAA